MACAIRSVSLVLVFLLFVTGCETLPNAETWKLPAKEKAGSAMIIGRIGFRDDKQKNPDNNVLKLLAVNFRERNRVVYFGDGEKSYTMSNNYFVVPNIEPGKYHFDGFKTAGAYNTFPLDDGNLIEIKPGQIKFVGSFDYLSSVQVVFGMRATSGTYELKNARKPTELEMFQWLNRIGSGSGWEPAINKKIRALGGKP